MQTIGATLKTATIILADDHPLVRRGVRSLFQPFPEYSIVAEAEDGFTAVELVERWSPDVLIVDITMPGLDGMEVTRQAAQRCPEIRSVILSMHEDEAHVFEALRAGATAYVLKRAVADDLVEAVRAALEGRRYLSPPLSARALEDYAAGVGGRSGQPLDAYGALTPRQREVLHLAAKGMTYAEIATHLGVSTHTVEAHLSNLMRKLGFRSTREIIRYAFKRGLTD